MSYSLNEVVCKTFDDFEGVPIHSNTPNSCFVLYIYIYIQGLRLASLAYSLIVNCFHWVIVVVGGRVHGWCKNWSGIKGHIL